MKNLYGVFLTLFLFSAPCWAGLTNGYVTVVKNASASCPSGGGTCPSYQNGSIFDTGTSSSLGNVGIGSTNPGQKLDVNGTVRASAFIAGTGTATLTGDSNGNVGINQATPAKTLDVNGTVKATALQIPGATTNYVLTASDSAGDATWAASATSSQWLGNAGSPITYIQNVGIGTSATPTGQLSIGSANQTFFNSSGNLGIGTAAAGAPLVVTGSGTVSLTTTGNVGIGTTVGVPNALYVVGTPMFTTGLNIGIGTASASHLCIANNAIATCL